MNENLETLVLLRNKLNGLTNTPHNLANLRNTFQQYKIILEITSNINDDFKRNLWGHFSELNRIENDLKDSTTGSSQKKKNDAFSTALSNIKSDLSALIELIKNSPL